MRPKTGHLPGHLPGHWPDIMSRDMSDPDGHGQNLWFVRDVRMSGVSGCLDESDVD
jgi:hypothetical protein